MTVMKGSRRPKSWDGRVTVRFTVQVVDTKSSDTVMLRVAPVLRHHHLQKVEKVLTAQNIQKPYHADFNNALDSITKAAGMKKDLYLFNVTDDNWIQDFVEPGYASMPGLNGTVSIQIMILCPRKERDGGLLLFLSFRKAGVGAVQHLGMSSLKTNPG
ncbi:arginine deiminase type-3 [Fusarium phyllophilum]|uniref:Arginine deiminase type-3 n=1 Tax=Fusarium phyllophilum TaxID=47803 RepID=A0A8H5NLK1_9HYPO|nr:arginine deiminase type-3 [Fusarium phyllophilum]